MPVRRPGYRIKIYKARIGNYQDLIRSMVHNMTRVSPKPQHWQCCGPSRPLNPGNYQNLPYIFYILLTTIWDVTKLPSLVGVCSETPGFKGRITGLPAGYKELNRFQCT